MLFISISPGSERFNKFKTQYKKLIRALSFIKPYKWYISVILLLTLILAAANSVEPLIMKYIFDSLGELKLASGVVSGVLFLLGLSLFKDLVSGISNWLSWKTRLNIQYGLLDATIAKLHRLPHEVHRKEGVGALMTRLDRGISGFMSAISEISFNVLPSVIYLVISIVIMFNLDWHLSLMVLLFIPFPGILAAYAAPKQTQREKNLLERWVSIYSRFNEVLSGIVTVRSFAMEDAEKQRFLGNVKNANNIVVKGIGYDTGIGVTQSLVITLSRITAIGFGAYLIINGMSTIGTLIAFLGYLSGLFGPVQGLTNIYKTLRLASVSLDQIFSILDSHDFLGDAPDAVELNTFTGEVSFEDVHFTYTSTNEEILKGINMHVKQGEKIAIVGPSGSGKTTLMALLMRFYTPDKGILKLSGMDICKLKQNWIRKNISVVLQDSLLFNESIKDNIAYGKPNASMEEIEQAARAANAHEFILKLEDGYNTIVGEKGSRLSGGERQRVAIARAILKNAPLIILDEATSALDSEVESQIQEAIDKLTRNKTTFIIAHRLATVVNSDRILVLKNGKIIESGKHPELMSIEGYYASLVEKQTRGLILN